jgi:hypothetical protein
LNTEEEGEEEGGEEEEEVEVESVVRGTSFIIAKRL